MDFKHTLKRVLPKLILRIWREAQMDKKPPSRKRIHHKFGETGLKINLGAGNMRIDKFITVDLNKEADIRMTIGKYNFPFEDNSVEMIYSSHFLEHLSFEQANFVFKEIYRVLQYNGRIRVSVPDFEFFIKKYFEKDSNFWDKKGWPGQTIALQLQYVSRGMGHMCMYDFETLQHLLVHTGFKNIERASFNPKFDNRPEISLIVTAIKK